MKKKLLLLTVLAMVMCLFALSVSADSINPSTSNEYGTLTTFDEAIGRTDISPNKQDGTVARTVLFDGTNYYTVPTIYLTSKNPYEGDILLQFSFSAINSKLSKSFSKTSVIRCELPADIVYLGGDNQNFNGFSNAIEIKLSPNLSFAGNVTYKAFANCKNLVEIDLSTVNFNYANNTYSLFEYCEKLEKIVLPDAYMKDGAPVNYATNYTFNGCKVLTSIENYENFFRGSTAISEKCFMDCAKLPEIKLWSGITTIGSRAFQNCATITEIIIPDTVTTIGTTDTVFASCTSLKKIVFPSGAVSVGTYAFEKCTALTDVWMPGAGSTFAAQVFGQCGSSLAVNFYFTTATSTITISNTTNNKDPFITAISAENDARIKYNTPLSTKCTVFLGGHHASDATADCTENIVCKDCTITITEAFDSHDIVITITYENGFTSDGVKTTACSRQGCTACDKSETALAIFSAKGYSYKESGSKRGLCGGFTVNVDAFNEYKEANSGKTITLSILMVNPKYINEESDFFSSEGQIIATGGAIQLEITELNYASLDFRVDGFTLEYMQSLEIAFALVVCDDGEVEVIQKQYGQDETSNVCDTYTDKNGIKLDSVTVQSIAPEVVEALKKEQEQA